MGRVINKISYSSRNPSYILEFNDGSIRELPSLGDIWFLGEGGHEGNNYYLSYCEWDFTRHPYCPVILTNDKYTFVDNKLRRLEFTFDKIWDIQNGEFTAHGAQQPTFILPNPWRNGICNVENNGKSYQFTERHMKHLFDYQQYSNEVKRQKPIPVSQIVEICKNLVPKECSSTPWNHPELNHGVNILRSQEALNCYMAAYGEAHIAKIAFALGRLPVESFSTPFEIFDWGCGQGLGTLCLIEFLKIKNIICNLKKITLIDPSLVALSRAFFNIQANSDVATEKINKGLPTSCNLQYETIDDISTQYNHVIHMFSNILDIETINIKRLADIIKSKNVNHIVLCIGTAFRGEERINDFCSCFNDYMVPLGNQIRIPEFFYRTSYGGHMFGCFIRNFKYSPH